MIAKESGPYWNQLRFGCGCKGLAVWSMGDKRIVNGDPSWHKSLSFRVVDSLYKPHKFTHNIRMEPRWSESVFSDAPMFTKQNEVEIGGPRSIRRRRQNCPNRGVGVIEDDGA